MMQDLPNITVKVVRPPYKKCLVLVTRYGIHLTYYAEPRVVDTDEVLFCDYPEFQRVYADGVWDIQTLTMLVNDWFSA